MTYLSTAHSCIIQNGFQREGKNMAAVESIGTCSEIKVQYESMKSLLGDFFISPPEEREG